MIKQVPKAWAKSMKTKVISLIIIGLLCNSFSYGQTKVLLENGSILNVSAVVIEDESIIINADNETKSISKSEVLCIIPEKKKAYTFRQKTNKKFKIRKKDIANNYQGEDLARVYAYKYYNNVKGYEIIGDLYKKNLESKLSEEEFNIIFREQHKKITKGVITGWIVSGVVFVISLNLMFSILNDIDQYSYNNLDVIESNNQYLEINNVKFYNNYLLVKKICA